MSDAKIVLSATDKTKAAFNSAKRNLGELNDLAASVAARAGTIGVALAAAFTGASLKGAIDSADALNDLSERTGISVENLSALKYAAQLSDASVEDLAKGVKGLGNNMAAAAGGNKEAIQSFRTIGVEIKTAGGQLRNTDDVLADVADKFSGYADGAEKAALATALFGKSGVAMIPFLNNGKAGLQAMREEAEKLGAVIGSDTAKAAAQFNDNLDRLAAAANGAKTALANDLLPSLVNFTNELVEGRKAFGGWLSALYQVGVKTSPFASYAEGADTARREVELLTKQLEEQQKVANRTVVTGPLGEEGAAFTGPRQRGGGGSQAATEEALADAKKRLEYFKALQRIQALQDNGDTSDAVSRRFERGRTPAPVLPDQSALSAAAAAAKQALDGRLKALDGALQDERDAVQFNNQLLDRYYQDGLLSLEAYYQAKRELAERDLAEQQRILDEELANLRAYRAKATTPEARADADDKITEVLRKKAAAEREAAQAAVISAHDQQRATVELKSRLADLDQEIQSLAGNDLGAALSRIGVQTQSVRKLLAQSAQAVPTTGDFTRFERGNGQAPAPFVDQGARADEFQLLATQQAQLTELRKQYAEITTKAQQAEELLQIEAEASGQAQVDVETDISALRRDAQTQLQALIQKTTELAAASQNPAALQFLSELQVAYGKAALAIDPALTRLRDLGKEAGQAIASDFEDAIVEGEKLRDVLGALAKDLERIFLRKFVTEPLADQLGSFINGLTGARNTQGGGVAEQLAARGAGALITSSGKQDAAVGAAKAVTDAQTSAATAQAANTVAVDAGTQAVGGLGQSSGVADSALAALGLSTGVTNFGLDALSSAAAEAAIALKLLASSAETNSSSNAAAALFTAKGNAFSSSGVISAFAAGDVFHAHAAVQAFARGDIFNAPTLFKFAQGGRMRDGVMGEAGPEAVMPLTQTEGGDLGVRVVGGPDGATVLPLTRGNDGKLAVRLPEALISAAEAANEVVRPRAEAVARGLARDIVADKLTSRAAAHLLQQAHPRSQHGEARPQAFAEGAAFGAGPAAVTPSAQARPEEEPHARPRQQPEEMPTGQVEHSASERDASLASLTEKATISDELVRRAEEAVIPREWGADAPAIGAAGPNVGPDVVASSAPQRTQGAASAGQVERATAGEHIEPLAAAGQEAHIRLFEQPVAAEASGRHLETTSARLLEANRAFAATFEARRLDARTMVDAVSLRHVHQRVEQLKTAPPADPPAGHPAQPQTRERGAEGTAAVRLPESLIAAAEAANEVVLPRARSADRGLPRVLAHGNGPAQAEFSPLASDRGLGNGEAAPTISERLVREAAAHLAPTPGADHLESGRVQTSAPTENSHEPGATGAPMLTRSGQDALVRLEKEPSTSRSITERLHRLGVHLFADGGVFGGAEPLPAFASGQVFDTPQVFTFGGGNVGALGESGPEGVFPLTRTADGQLGVRGVGGSGGDRIANVTVNVPQGTSRASAGQIGARVAQDVLYAYRRNR